jgi:hypothetical protein
MSRVILVLGIAASLAAGGRRAEADDYDALAAYLALTTTPVGLVGPETPAIAGRARGPRVALRYGRLTSPFEEEDKVHTVAVAVGLPAGGGRVDAIVGRPIFCDNGDCEGQSWVAGLGWNSVLLRGEAGSGTELSLGITPSLGTSWQTDDDFALRFLSMHVGVPLAVTLGRGTRWTLFATPGAGWGELRFPDITESGLRATIGGGLAVVAPEGIGLQVGLQKVLFEGGRTQVGVGVSWQ